MRKEEFKPVEFKDLRFIPNDPKYLNNFIEDQDNKGKNANILGKSLDVLEEWVKKYNCDLEKLKTYKGNPKIYLPQPKLNL